MRVYCYIATSTLCNHLRNVHDIRVRPDVTDDPVDEPSSSSSANTSSVPVTDSKKMKLVRKHAPIDDLPDGQIHDDIRNYLRYVPGEQ